VPLATIDLEGFLPAVSEPGTGAAGQEIQHQAGNGGLTMFPAVNRTGRCAKKSCNEPDEPDNRKGAAPRK
jgi:hypothetical protein